jgi:hypothetical protein
MSKETANYIGLNNEKVILKGNAAFIQNGLEIADGICGCVAPIWIQSRNTTAIKSCEKSQFAYDFVRAPQE